jgi:DedD protein
MASQIVSRTQRRLEKKQAMVLLSLILGVSLVSFTLGVMVGKRRAPAAAAQPTAVPERLPVVGVPAGASGGADSAPAAEAPKTENLTFFDTLPKGEQSPLGSGINLPPKKEAAPVSATPAATPPPSPASPAVHRPAVPAPAAPAAGVANREEWSLQVASFREAEDARKLMARLVVKGYAAFTQEADLGVKGKWYRVMVGPFTTETTVNKTADRLKREEKLSALVRRN